MLYLLIFSIKKSIYASVILNDVYIVPKHIILSIFRIGVCPLRVLNKTTAALSIGIGHCVWHGSEYLVRHVRLSKEREAVSYSVLSTYPITRDIVYRAVGMTVLAAGAVCIPILPIQMIAIPIIVGSLYGTLNNQFTVRECPEYYTMGHNFDSVYLRRHAVRTNNLIVKPFITGCYGTTSYTKIAGAILGGMSIYAPEMIPITMTVSVIGATVLTILVIAHIFSNMKKNNIVKNIEQYTQLIDMEFNEEVKNMTWDELEKVRTEHIERKRHMLVDDKEGLDLFNQNLLRLEKSISASTLAIGMPKRLPMKYMIGWSANSSRNLIGYLSIVAGALALTVTAVFLKIY